MGEGLQEVGAVAESVVNANFKLPKPFQESLQDGWAILNTAQQGRRGALQLLELGHFHLGHQRMK